MARDFYFKGPRGFLYKHLCVKKYKYRYYQSNRLGKNRSYYFKSFSNPMIRISNHYLHPNQEIENIIDVILIDDEISTINKKPIFFPDDIRVKHFKKIILEYIELEIKLFQIRNRR